MEVFIEQTGEEHKKNIFDKNSGLFKTIPFHLTYPYPYGYILDTLTPDGDELDCYIITNAKLETASSVECKPIGMVEWFEDGEEDHKILAVIKGESYKITNEVKEKLTHFASSFYKHAPNKKYQLGKFYDKTKAEELIKKASQIPRTSL
jgi:inorganic pyrophosphatase